MHPNKAFRPEDEAPALAMVRSRGFGVLTVSGPDGVLASHIPFLLDDTRIQAHLVRSNPVARLLREGPTDALLIVSGPDAYISPDWYLVADQVPTWNYVAVHLRGTLSLLNETALMPHLEALSNANEARLAPKKIWTHDKMSDGVMEKMMRQIVPVSLAITSLEQTWKLNQNKSEAARQSAAHAVERSPIGQEQSALSALMRDL